VSAPIETIPLAIIGGTGLNQLDQSEPLQQPPVETPYGPTSASLQMLVSGQQRVTFIARHGQPHTIPPHKINYRANLWALREAGIRQVVAVNSVGGITAAMATGAIVVPHQIVDYTWGREHTYHDSDSLEHIDFTQPYSEALRQRILRAASAARKTVIDGGVYAATQGPRLETAAEVDRLARDGCDIVGMTGMPEAALARELGLQYAAICLVVNPAAGRAPGEITMADIRRVIDEGMGRVQSVLTHLMAG